MHLCVCMHVCVRSCVHVRIAGTVTAYTDMLYWQLVPHAVAEGYTHLQCVVCDSGNWCFSPSHCMTDCVDVLFYRQWTMRS